MRVFSVQNVISVFWLSEKSCLVALSTRFRSAVFSVNMHNTDSDAEFSVRFSSVSFSLRTDVSCEKD